jgi:hypothetical protein
VKPLLASSPWLTIHPSIHRKLAAAAAILTASGLAAPAFANNPIEPPAYSAVDRLAAEEGGDPLYQRGSKVGTIQIGVTTAKTSITIGNVTYVPSWIEQGDGTFENTDGDVMTVPLRPW